MATKQLRTRRTSLVSGETVGRQTEQTITVYDNILPHPQEMQQYRDVSPELITLIMETTRAEQIQRHQDMTKKMNLVSDKDRRFFKISALSVVCAFLIMVLGMLLSAYLIYKDKDIIGTIFAGATILTVAGMFLSNARKGGYGGKSDTEPT
jgi:uncharacterized membrane protein